MNAHVGKIPELQSWIICQAKAMEHKAVNADSIIYTTEIDGLSFSWLSNAYHNCMTSLEYIQNSFSFCVYWWPIKISSRIS